MMMMLMMDDDDDDDVEQQRSRAWLSSQLLIRGASCGCLLCKEGGDGHRGQGYQA
jgi:hypothetical protein